MKILFFIVSFILTAALTPKLSQVRADYGDAMGDAEKVNTLHQKLATVTKADNKVMVAYKGAVMTAMAKHSKSKKEKKDFFKEGVGLLEYAVGQDPKNIEIRTIRLSIQENAPKFLRYHANIDEDKEFILKNYKTISSTEIQEFVRKYVQQSTGFSDAEKDSL
jgi:hypothetical protein